MLSRTHLAFGVLAGIISHQFIDGDMISFLLVVAFASLMPDLDHPDASLNRALVFTKLIPMVFKHRGILHTLWSPILLSLVVTILANPFYGLAAFVGYTSHLVSDAMTKKGINFLYPFSQFKIAGFIETGTWMETVTFVVLVGLIIVKLS